MGSGMGTIRKWTGGLAVIACLYTGATNASVITLDVTANIDGRDALIISGNTLTWRHFDYTAVGLHNPSYPSTILTTTLDGATDLSGYAWTPTWPGGTGWGAYSSTFAGLSPALPLEDMTVSLVVNAARQSIVLSQLPSAANGFTTIVEFNDNGYGSDANYRGTLTFITSDAAVPEPASLALLAVGLVGFALSRRRRS